MKSKKNWESEIVARLTIFVQNWRNFQGTELSGAQEFLRKLLDVYEVSAKPGTIFEQHPIQVPEIIKSKTQGNLFAATQPVQYTAARMDLYLPKVCVWEMKAPDEKDLQKHHDQVLGYWARMRTRYMVLCNFKEFWIYDTEDENGQLIPKLKFLLSDLPERADALLFLRGEVPELTRRSERVTADVAQMLGNLVRDVIQTAENPKRDRERIAKFILECVFAMFAEDTDLIPAGMFTDCLLRAHKDGSMEPVWSLFDDFSLQEAANRGNQAAPYINGPLFDRDHPKIKLTKEQIFNLYIAARDFDWQDVRPEIFGSIFEQALDPIERHELGAHFTREADIEKVILPTIVEPWRERIARLRMPRDAELLIEELKQFHVLDPACGCANFLYIVYREMKRLEKALAQKWDDLQRKIAKKRADIAPPPKGPWFTIKQLHGIEINEFAAQLARVVLWIGEHLARRELNLKEEVLPLKQLDDTIIHGDALFTPWPRPLGELSVVGNPPYLGVRKMRHELGDEYVDKLFEKYPENRAADFVTYWFPRALETLREGERAGFVCTNSISQNESREASIDKLIAKGGTILDAWKSYPWPGEAAVHVGIVNWLMAPWDGIRRLDGEEVASISPALTKSIDVTAARRIEMNEDISFMGVTPGNTEFVLTVDQKNEIIASDPHSSKVIKPFLVGMDVNREVDQKPTRWIIDFGMMTKAEAEKFPEAFKYVRKHVYPIRKENRRESYAKYWWRFVEPRSGMRSAIKDLKHVLVIPSLSPHLIVSRQRNDICFDHQLMVLGLPDYYHFGILLSRFHSTWAWAKGSTLEERLRYTNTTIFETFPFPILPDGKYIPRGRPVGREANQVAHYAEKFEQARLNFCSKQNVGLTKIHNEIEKGEPKELVAIFDALNDAVNECYGFPKGTWRDEKESLNHLMELNQRVADSGIGNAIGEKKRH